MPEDDIAAVLHRLSTNPAVCGVILTGSHALGLATPHSDYDLLVIAADGAEHGLKTEERRDAVLDVGVMPMRELAVHAMPGSGSEYGRYTFVHAQVLHDVTGGQIGELVDRKRTLSSAEVNDLAPGALDGFLNSTYRSLKDSRDGYPNAARLDAATAVPGYLTYVFALHHRVRPYNKYLAWELDQEPLDGPQWQKVHLLGLLDGVLSHDPSTALHQLVNELEPPARAAGHGNVLDAWGDDLKLMRGQLS